MCCLSVVFKNRLKCYIVGYKINVKKKEFKESWFIVFLDFNFNKLLLV